MNVLAINYLICLSIHLFKVVLEFKDGEDAIIFGGGVVGMGVLGGYTV